MSATNCILACVFITTGFMEMMRRMIQVKGHKYILWLIGFLVSLGTVSLVYYTIGILQGSDLSILFYGLIVYFIQKELTMECLKPLINKFIGK